MRNGVNRPRSFASDSIWTTSSRGGAITSMRGVPVPADPAGGAGVRSMRVNAAIRKAAVLPVPVCDWPATSLPLSASGSAASWIGVAVTKPASRIPCITGSGRSSVIKSIYRSARPHPTWVARARCVMSRLIGARGRTPRGWPEQGASCRGLGGRRGRSLPEDPRADDPDLVEQDERARHQRLVEHVGCGRQHRAGDERAEDRVLPVLGERRGRDDAEPCQDRDDERELEDRTERERELQQEVDVASDRDHRLEARPLVREQELDRERRDDLEREGPTADEEQGPDDDERPGVLLLVPVQPRRDELPHLPEDQARGDEQAGDYADLHLDPERLGEGEEDEAAVRLAHGPDEVVHDLLAEDQRGDEPDEERQEAPHDPGAELPEVLHERHPALVHALRHPYQPVTKCRSVPTPRPAWNPSRIAAVTYAFASRMASPRGCRRASPAAIADEKVQPVPWVLGDARCSPAKRVNSRPFQRMSVARSGRWPPLTRTWRGPSARIRRAASSMAASVVTVMPASAPASWRFGVTTYASGSSSLLSASRAAGSSSGSPDFASPPRG